MPLVDLDAIPQVPLDFINDDHREEARLLNELAEAVGALRAGGGSAAAVAERFAALDAHTREHFAREEEAMRRAAFPPYPMHKGEHDRVLAEMAAEGRRFQDRGDAARLWTYVSETVPSWFVGHIQSMDLITARFIATRDG
jgi:hemerythrin